MMAKLMLQLHNLSDATDVTTMKLNQVRSFSCWGLKPELFKYAIVFLWELDGTIWNLTHVFNFHIPSNFFHVQSSTTILLISNNGFPPFFLSLSVMNEKQGFWTSICFRIQMETHEVP